jgi:hypothetical protein
MTAGREVYAAGLFLYGRKGIGIKMDDLLNESLAVATDQANFPFTACGLFVHRTLP